MPIIILYFLYSLHEEDLWASELNLNDMDVKNQSEKKFPSWLQQYICKFLSSHLFINITFQFILFIR